MTSRRIILWRHGRTAWNAERRFQGQTDIPLDDTGRAQAARAAKVLARLHPHRIRSSDLSRARATADALAGLTGLAVTDDVDLRETYAGEWQGLTRTELEERFGADLQQWAAGAEIRPGGGETRSEVAARMVAAVDRRPRGHGAGGDPRRRDARGSRESRDRRPARPADRALGGPRRAGELRVVGAGGEHVRRTVRRWRLQEYNAGSLPVTALADDG